MARTMYLCWLPILDQYLGDVVGTVLAREHTLLKREHSGSLRPSDNCRSFRVMFINLVNCGSSFMRVQVL